MAAVSTVSPAATARPVLVTGAMGQLGQPVVHGLLARGHAVVALDRPCGRTRAAAERMRADAPSGMAFDATFVDLLDADAVAVQLCRYAPQAIVHLAAVVSPPCYKNPMLARRVNVEGTRNVVQATQALATPALLIAASSSAVYGSRNPHRHPERITAATPVNPVECYGEDKVAAEQIVAASGLPFATLRLGGIISPAAIGLAGPEYFLLMRATPGDNRVHAVDVRDAAAAFVNAVDRQNAIAGKTLLIGGNESYVLRQRELEDDVMQAIGLGRLGPYASLPGDPDDERGWGLTDWFDTRESQALLGYQQHDWAQTLAWLASSQGWRRTLTRVLAPVVRPALLGYLRAQRRWERRGAYAAPWTLVSQKYGTEILAPSRF